MDKIVTIYSEINSEASYFSDMDQIAVKLEEILKDNIFEHEVQNTSDLARIFVKGDYRYYPSRKVSVYSLKSFAQLIKTSNTEKKNLIKLGVINRLRIIKKVDKPSDNFADDIPF
jgi:hypothetical protein